MTSPEMVPPSPDTEAELVVFFIMLALILVPLLGGTAALTYVATRIEDFFRGNI